MTAFVTGGTGFVGAHVVRALLAEGESVRCLVRAGSRRDNLEDLAPEVVVGDLSDVASLERFMAGCDLAIHCAADYRLYAQNPREIYSTNVEGTRLLLEAAAQAGVARVVHTSSVGTLAATTDDSAADEDTPVDLHDMVGHYKRSKFLAERVAEHYARQGLFVVIVNPSTPVGELDIKPTPTGRMILDFLNGRMPAYVDTGLNLVDVRDVASGHLLAAERGASGERYILGNLDMTLREILDVLSELTGLPRVRLRVPHVLPTTFAALDTSLSRAFGRVPRVSLESAVMARKKMFFDPSRAVRELGLRQTPVRDALERAVAWFVTRGYVTRGKLADMRRLDAS